MKTKRILSNISDCLFIGLFVYLLIFPQKASEPTRFALEFCAKTLIPSLFIYTVLAKTVLSTDLVQRISKKLGIVPITLVIGTLCGCPIGAKLSLSLYESRQIDKRLAEYLCSFANNASTSFILGFVGNELFGDALVGVRLLVYQLTASVITAAIMKRMIYKNEPVGKICTTLAKRASLSKSLTDGAMAMINIASSSVFFIVVSNVISHTAELSGHTLAITKSILEFSSGCSEAAKLGDFAIPITAFALGHCGASVAMQVKSVLSGKLSMRPYFAGKAMSCAIMTLLAVIFG